MMLLIVRATKSHRPIPRTNSFCDSCSMMSCLFLLLRVRRTLRVDAFELEALREIGFGLGRPAQPRPQHPTIAIDLRVALIERERLVVIGEGGFAIALRITGVRAIVVAFREARVQFDGAGVVGDRAVQIAPRKTQIASIAIRRGVPRVEFDGAVEVRERACVVSHHDAGVPAVVISRGVLLVGLDGATIIASLRSALDLISTYLSPRTGAFTSERKRLEPYSLNIRRVRVDCSDKLCGMV